MYMVGSEGRGVVVEAYFTVSRDGTGEGPTCWTQLLPVCQLIHLSGV